MENKRVLSVVLVLSAASVGCGGVDTGTRPCANGTCETTTCAGDTYAVGAECVAFSVCAPGWYVAKPGTATADTVCELCPSGTFSIMENSSSCSPWGTCPAGTYVANIPTTMLDRSCLPCRPGTLSTGPNQSACLPADQCRAGTVQTASGTTTSSPVCADCRPGEYCAGGANDAVKCSADKWDDDSNPATICVDKTVCSPGNQMGQEGSATSDRTCTPCTPGTFSSTNNAATCQLWRHCEPGSYAANAPTAVSDRLCIDCPAGTYTSEADQSVCLTASDCGAGTVQAAPGSATSAPVCTDCESGEYCPGGSMPARSCSNETWDHDGNPATACVGWTFCRAGTYVAVAGSPTSDQECFPCSAGTFSAVSNASSCTEWTACGAGSFVGSSPSTISDRGCVACPARTFSVLENSSACTPRSECPTYTHFVSATSTPYSDTQCSSCTAVGCSKYCDNQGRCLDCVTDGDCQSGATCVDTMCKTVTCGSDMVYFSETFSSGNAQLWWRNDGNASPWEIGSATAWAGGAVASGTFPDPTTDHSSGEDNMLAGVVIGGIAPTDLTAEPHFIATRSFDISGAGDVYLEYYHWLNSDSAQAMVNKVQVYDGQNWVTVWSGPDLDDTGVIGENAWRRSVHDVTAYKNADFAVQFGYQVLSSSVQNVSGWNIDDIRVAAAPSCP